MPNDLSKLITSPPLILNWNVMGPRSSPSHLLFQPFTCDLCGKVEYRFWASTRMVKRDGIFLASDLFGKGDHCGTSFILPTNKIRNGQGARILNALSFCSKNLKVVEGMLQNQIHTTCSWKMPSPSHCGGKKVTRQNRESLIPPSYRGSKTAMPLTVGHQRSIWHPS